MSLIEKNPDANALIFTDSIYKIKEKINYPVFNYEGENNRNVLIVTLKSLSIKEREFIEKILAAVKLQIHDTAILGINNYPNLGFSDVKKYFLPKKIIFFGTKASQIGLNADIPFYTLGKMDSLDILMAEPLSQIAESEESKKKLWTQLKALFNV